ncbi:MAG: CCA tRNA nucleotidyltransferase [Candidatus Vogelbacteria bacterium]|nr:CCA tRNA nucleotidyltransferase [Candidatus Vogelbacteria bacterium]
MRIPEEIIEISNRLKKQGFASYLVGGCVRALLMKKEPKDWDIATDASPEQITRLFDKTFYENAFGTVTVVNEEAKDENLRHIEITPFRQEAKYSDKRHPDKVTFTTDLQTDLGRRDFTINAIAYETDKGQIIDPYKGQEDIKDKIVRAVGQPKDRFEEDPLRILRGVRLAAELNFTINLETMGAMVKSSKLLGFIATERIRDEFSRILMSNNLMPGIVILQKIGALKQFLPELEEGIGMKQNGDHKYEVWEHILRVAQHAADRYWPLHVRLAALFHDIGKPRTRKWGEEKKDWTFYGHDLVGAKMARKIMERLRFTRNTTDTVEKLVRNHMFFTDIEKITLSAVRRIIRNVGHENIWDLMKIRNCDRIGMGRPKESPYRLRKYESMIEEAMRDPTSVKMLKINGEDVSYETGLKPSPKIGYILHALLEEVLDNPSLNTESFLRNKAKELALLPDEQLKKIGERGRGKKESIEQEELEKIRGKYGVK